MESKRFKQCKIFLRGDVLNYLILILFIIIAAVGLYIDRNLKKTNSYKYEVGHTVYYNYKGNSYKGVIIKQLTKNEQPYYSFAVAYLVLFYEVHPFTLYYGRGSQKKFAEIAEKDLERRYI